MQTFNQYYADNNDAREYQLKLHLFTFAIFVCFGAFVTGWLNIWLMVVIVSVAVTRWMIVFHELFHLRRPEELDYLSRLQIIPFSPFNMGYREYRDMHMRHHKYVATTNDPDAFHIMGGPLKALFGAVTQQEQATFRYIKANGISQELATMIAIRLSLFISMFLISPTAFLIWWLVLRTTYIVNDFVFFHLVHYRSGSSGTFPIPLPKYIEYLTILVYGIDVVYATMHHDIHHKHARIAAKYLPKVDKELHADYHMKQH
ncbi:MAG: fatty acid desaturase [Betaproteobacteria bacterium]|nr:fatty acid desaturase [Betaproteobacteria bacterium]